MGGSSFSSSSFRSSGRSNRGLGSSSFGFGSASVGSPAFSSHWSPVARPTVASSFAVFAPSPFSSAFSLIFFAAVMVLLASSLLEQKQGGALSSSEAGKVAVVRLQVGLLGMARSLQDDLERLAETADTSSKSGLHLVLQETVLALLRHPEYCVYADSGGVTLSGPEAAEGRFNEASVAERAKMSEETLVNVGGRKRSKASKSTSTGDGGRNELIVVTILVAADAPLKLPKVESLEALKEALKALGGVRRGGLQAVEVLWTPQEEGDSLTQEELSAAYPALRQI
jgi:uncharacterized membrane protein